MVGTRRERNVNQPPPNSIKKKLLGKRRYHATQVAPTVMVLRDTTDGLRHHQTGMNRLFLFCKHVSLKLCQAGSACLP
ncbi:hypothetical protein RclHR1_00090035 [Rhizophagus clarus]|uniref:Uncharacterized protein n=1 Tax=Rhizophagus clarus TaxID=94130 RepID=A0A2Z6S538_9GLOM|nr:hypothetical protein RclHR1_00090035 [Rhizophagus clarus]GES90482.1 hypothetical protein RCL_e27472_RclHR1_00090035 [Rhizophagus clarus]